MKPSKRGSDLPAHPLGAPCRAWGLNRQRCQLPPRSPTGGAGARPRPPRVRISAPPDTRTPRVPLLGCLRGPGSLRLRIPKRPVQAWAGLRRSGGAEPVLVLGWEVRGLESASHDWGKGQGPRAGPTPAEGSPRMLRAAPGPDSISQRPLRPVRCPPERRGPFVSPPVGPRARPRPGPRGARLPAADGAEGGADPRGGGGEDAGGGGAPRQACGAGAGVRGGL